MKSHQGTNSIDSQLLNRGSTEPQKAISQYSVRQVVGIWALAAIPMGLLAWVAAPAIASSWEGGGNGLLRALLVCLTGGLVWQGILTLVLVFAEQGNVRLSTLQRALWLRQPVSPRNQKVGGKVWWMLGIGLVALSATSGIPLVNVVAERDFETVLKTDAGEAFFHGNWAWFAVVVALVVFNTVLGEEILFRGLLLPRMEGAFGRFAWVANAVLFGVYHLHTPWAIPLAFASGAVFAYSTQRYRSAWFGILLHSVQSVIVLVVVLAVVV